MNTYKNLETVLSIYYGHTELTNALICKLFNVSRSTALRYKNKALELQLERKHKTMNPNSVNTKDAFDAWGIDINDIERCRKKLIELKLENVAV
ncbi:MAG: hypothetical protein ACI4EA_07540 [Candidatus Ornithomonoglobus sp.]